MTMTPTGQGLPLRRITCARCGTPFECGVNAGACWCMEEAYRLPMPDDRAADCLCPGCLRAAAAKPAGLSA